MGGAAGVLSFTAAVSAEFVDGNCKMNGGGYILVSPNNLGGH